jgi:transposase
MENDFNHFIGIDVSKEKKEKTLLVLENTGKYESICMRTLINLGFKLHRVNNRLTKYFMKLLGLNAKTDKIDATGLANYGKWAHKGIDLFGKKKIKPLEVCSKEVFVEEDLKQISNHITELKRSRAAYKNRRKSPCTVPDVHDSNQRIIDCLTEEIEAQEKMLDELIEKNKKVSEKIDLITQYKGIGKTTARELVIHLPELGELPRISALSGLAPYIKQSGNSTFYSTTKGTGQGLRMKNFLYRVE